MRDVFRSALSFVFVLIIGFCPVSGEALQGLFLDRPSKNARAILTQHPQLTEVEHPSDARVIWLRYRKNLSLDQLGPRQILNRIAGEETLIEKGPLLRALKNYQDTHPESPLSYRDFHPETYSLVQPEDRALLKERLPSLEAEDAFWIMKPSSLSRGMGMKILENLDSIKADLEAGRPIVKHYNGKDHEYLLQRYIKDVLLLNDRKSEIRVYWLIASLDPLLVYVYPEGTVRMTCQPYKLADFDNPSIHLTNIYQQKNSEGFDPNATLKWDFSTLDSYAHIILRQAPAGWVKEELMPRVREMIAYVAKAAVDELRRGAPETGYAFGLYGADIILDKNLTPWLTEIQGGPGISYTDPIKKELIPNILLEAMDIVLEVNDRKDAGKDLRNLASVKHFDAVVSGG